MYLSFYNFTVKPFEISTDPKFLWIGEKHKEALAVLKYGILDNKGFILLTGDAGTGKTTLVNALRFFLHENIKVATIYDPALDLLDFYNLIANAFGIDQQFNNKAAFLIYFKNFLLYNHDEGKKNLLIIDEAQKIKPGLLEEIRMLSNIELDHFKLLNIFFVGQSEFNNILLQPENIALRQRITVNYHIEPLNEKETREYIAKRISIAGASQNMFRKSAMREIFRFSNGNPRLINIICDRALLSGYTENCRMISSKLILECADEFNINKFTAPSYQTTKTKKFDRKKQVSLITLSIILILTACTVGYLFFEKLILN